MEKKTPMEVLVAEINRGQAYESERVRKGSMVEYWIMRESVVDGAVRVENQPMREQRRERERSRGPKR